MNRYLRIALALGVFTVMGTSVASAQASRTWVSGVGDDANPCSRTAPCKTFAGAISKTATNGEINVLDPGGFGCVTITKSLTISGEGTLGGILAAGTPNCIVVNDTNGPAPGTSFVTLRYLSLNGFGTGTNGINFINGAGLIIEHVFLTGFNTAIRTDKGNTTARDVTIVRNSGFGARALGGSITFEDSTFANNSVAIQSEGTGIIRLSNSSFYNNGTAFSCLTGGTLFSVGNNRKANNTGGPGTVCATVGAVTLQ